MLGLDYFRAEPTEYARMTVGGKVKREGKGVAGFYLPFRTSIEVVLTTTQDQPFTFQEVSSDQQEVALQGGIVYRVTDPPLLLGRYNFSVEPREKEHLTDDPQKLAEYLAQRAKVGARKVVEGTKLENVLRMGDQLSHDVTDTLRSDAVLREIGLTVEGIYFTSLKPKPEIARGLEATYREELLQKADEAGYKRRAAAVEKERAIRQNEVDTLIEVEKKRKELVDLEGANVAKQAEFKADAERLLLKVYESMDPQAVLAHAMLQLGKNAGQIGTLTITPDILSGLLNSPVRPNGGPHASR